MVKKTKVLEILEDIETKLNYREWKEAEKDVEYYIKNLEITVDKGITTLIGEYEKYLKKFGEDSIKTKIFAKKIDKKLLEIYNKKI